MKVKTTVTTKTNPVKTTKKVLIDENGVEFMTLTAAQGTGNANVRPMVLNRKAYEANREAAEKIRAEFTAEASGFLEAGETVEESEEEV